MLIKICHFHLHLLKAPQIQICLQSNYLVIISFIYQKYYIFFFRSLDSRSTSLEGIGQMASCIDSDSDDELDLPDWASNVPAEILDKLSSKEKKRQEVINELYYTERSHIRGKMCIIFSSDLLYYVI